MRLSNWSLVLLGSALLFHPLDVDAHAPPMAGSYSAIDIATTPTSLMSLPKCSAAATRLLHRSWSHPGCCWTCLHGREGHGGCAHVPAHTAVGTCATHIAGQDHIAVNLFCIERNSRIKLKFQNLLISLTYTIVHLLYKCCHKETQKSEGFISVYDFGSNSKLEEHPFPGENTSWKIQKQSF